MFRHERDPLDVATGTPVIRARGPEVLVPVIMKTLGGVLAVRHVGGHTGACRQSAEGVPAADVRAVIAVSAETGPLP